MTDASASTTTTETATPRLFTVASRASVLAQIQTNIVVDSLRAAFPALDFTTSFMSTEGDKNQSQALYVIGGKALWTKDLEVSLGEGAVSRRESRNSGMRALTIAAMGLLLAIAWAAHAGLPETPRPRQYSVAEGLP